MKHKIGPKVNTNDGYVSRYSEINQENCVYN